MSSKILDLFLLTFTVLLVLSASAFAAKKPATETKSEPTTSQDKIIPGRYQLFQGKYRSSEVVIGAASKTEYVEGLFLLDTVTGDLFLCESFFYANSESDSKAVKGLLYKKSCSPFRDETRSLKDE